MFLVLDATFIEIRSVQETVGQGKMTSISLPFLFFQVDVRVFWLSYPGLVINIFLFSMRRDWVEFWTLWTSALLGEEGSRAEQMGRCASRSSL